VFLHSVVSDLCKKRDGKIAHCGQARFPVPLFSARSVFQSHATVVFVRLHVLC